MRTLAAVALVLGLVSTATIAHADVPKIGDPMPWPTVRKFWLGDPPNASDAAGKIVVHWYCSAKNPTCKDDLARLVEMREANPRVYVIAYLSNAKNKKAAMKLDPIRDDVGAGATAYGKEVDRLGATIGLPSGGSIVQNVDGRVALIAPSTDADFLDKRDAKIKELAEAIREYTLTKNGPTAVKLNERFTLEVTIQLASWLTTTTKSPVDFVLTVPPNVTCTAAKLATKDVKMDARSISGSFSCTATKAGNYEMSASLRFGYENPTKATGVGSDSARWKFTAK